ATEEPAWRRDRHLHGLAIDGIAREHRRLRLWLAIAAHRAVHHGAAVIEPRQRWIERVKGFLARAQGVDVLRIEREGASAVLPVHSAFRQHQSAAEFMIDALDKGHRAAFAIDDAHPYGVARTSSL